MIYILIFVLFFSGGLLMAYIDYRYVKKVCEKNYINFEYFYKKINLRKEAKKIIDRKKQKEIKKKYYKN